MTPIPEIKKGLCQLHEAGIEYSYDNLHERIMSFYHDPRNQLSLQIIVESVVGALIDYAVNTSTDTK